MKKYFTKYVYASSLFNMVTNTTANKMITRSNKSQMTHCVLTSERDIKKQSKKINIHLCDKEYTYWDDYPIIDFDDAHDSWMENKRKGPNGTYYYICGKIQKNGKTCVNKQVDTLGLYSGCKRHFKWEEKTFS